MNSKKLTTRDIALIGLMIAIIEACKFVLANIPNVELTTFWVILFTLYFRKKIIYVIPVFILIEGILYGFGMWWIMYLYAWPLLAFVVYKLRAMTSALSWSILSGLFGLCFGLLCAIPYVFIGAAGNTFLAGLQYAFFWWTAGIPWDIIHCIGNFFIMLILYQPVSNIMRKVVTIS